MKRYLLFASEFYYPRGGWSDFQGDYDSTDETIAAAQKLAHVNFGAPDWFEIIDTKIKARVLTGGYIADMVEIDTELGRFGSAK